ncbi:hypothetical protein EXIGLDRAFT_691497 [Exidia glandulosa HHB12029]|uniref:Protein kinase domain-containing protein n=1 Tax=Exidia glandulosa HHB12029 TaxID=1314781 RepID=A0A165IKL2_EXIGL|nr:hypothetical protein EXIGLDRAFT_691497 [Exidia glandulosa HHB12029]
MEFTTSSESRELPDRDSQLVPLKQYLAENPDADRGRILRQIADGIERYHNVDHMIHGAIKMANVVVDEHGNAHLMKSAASVPITSQPSTPATPEERLPMTSATDIYALGWLTFHVFTDIDPQDLARNPKIMSMIASGVKPNRPGLNTLPTKRGLNDSIWAVLLQCWGISPAARPSITAFLRSFDVPAPALAPKDLQG